MDNVKFCYITQKYYNDNPNLIKLLDVNDESKQNIRTHLCLAFAYKNCKVLIPLRKNLGDAIRKFGKIGFPVPSSTKPKAGLDYRCMILIDDESYIRYDSPRISKIQIDCIKNNYTTIENEAVKYINEYIKTASKNRIQKTAKFRESSLINFHDKLNL